MSLDEHEISGIREWHDRTPKTELHPQDFLESSGGQWFKRALEYGDGSKSAAAAEAVITAGAISLTRTIDQSSTLRAWSRLQGSRELVDGDHRILYMHPDGGRTIIANSDAMHDVYEAPTATVISRKRALDSREPEAFISTLDLNAMGIPSMSVFREISSGAALISGRRLEEREQRAISDIALIQQSDAVGNLWEANITGQSRDELSRQITIYRPKASADDGPNVSPEVRPGRRLYLPLFGAGAEGEVRLYRAEQWNVLRGGLASSDKFTDPLDAEEAEFKFHATHELVISAVRSHHASLLREAMAKANELAAQSGRKIDAERADLAAAEQMSALEKMMSYTMFDDIFPSDKVDTPGLPNLVKREFIVDALRIASETRLMSFDNETGVQGYVLEGDKLLTCAPASLDSGMYWMAAEQLKPGQDSLMDQIVDRASKIGQTVLYS